MAGQEVDAQAQFAQIVRLHLEGNQAPEIAARVGLPQAQVTRQLALARRRWKEAERARQERTSEFLAELDGIENRLKVKWERLWPYIPPEPFPGSPGDGERDGRKEVADDAHLAQIAAESILAKSVLKGAASAGPSSVADDYISHMSPEEVERGLERFAHGHGLAREKATT